MEDEDMEETNNEDCGQRARRLATLRKRRQREKDDYSTCVSIVYTMLRRALIRHQLARGLHCIALVIIRTCSVRTTTYVRIYAAGVRTWRYDAKSIPANHPGFTGIIPLNEL